MDSLERVLELGRLMDRPRTIIFNLTRADYDFLCELTLNGDHVSIDTLVRGIVLDFINKYRDEHYSGNGGI